MSAKDLTLEEFYGALDAFTEIEREKMMSASDEQLKADCDALTRELIFAEIRGMQRAAQLAKKIWYDTDALDKAIQAEIDSLKKLKNER